jgi:hypothetical protein
MPFTKKTNKGSAAETEHNPKLTQRTQQSTDPKLMSDEITNLKYWVNRVRARTNVRLTQDKENPPKIIPDHADPEVGFALLMDAIGTLDPDFYKGLLSQLATFNTDRDEVNFDGLNFMLSIIKGVSPRDQSEAILGAHMAVAHVTALMVAKRLKDSKSTVELESMERSYNKLCRTYITQMECLNRYRARGPQMVQNVSVGEGGQVLVANLGQPPTGGERVSASAPPTGETNVVPLEARERMSVLSPGGKKIER